MAHAGISNNTLPFLYLVRRGRLHVPHILMRALAFQHVRKRFAWHSSWEADGFLVQITSGLSCLFTFSCIHHVTRETGRLDFLSLVLECENNDDLGGRGSIRARYG